MPAPKVAAAAVGRRVMSKRSGSSRPVAVAGERAHHHHGARREGHVAVLHVLDDDPRGERGDRLVAQHLVDRPPRPAVARRAAASHCSGCSANRRMRVRELGLGGVDAAHEHVEDEVDALDVGEAVALRLGGEQRRDEVVAGVPAPARRNIAPRTLVELARPPARSARARSSAPRRRTALDPVRPVVQPRRVVERRAHHGRDGERRVRLGEGLDELAAPVGARPPPRAARGRSLMAGRQRSAARGVKAGLTRLRRRRWSSPLMWRMLRRSSSRSGPFSMPKSSASFSPGKVVARLRRKNSAASRSSTIAADRRRRQPALGAQLDHARVEGRTAQVGVGVVEDRKLELGQQRHGGGNLPCRPGSPARSPGVERAWSASISGRCASAACASERC